MWWAAKQLSVPLNYLRIRHGSGFFHSKLLYDLGLPFIFAALTCLYFQWLSISFAIFEHPALVKRLTDLLALMIVFYMAALAAVATFDRDGIDDDMEGDPATLKIRDPNDAKKRIVKPLSYRRFISYLFGYLSFLSLVLYVFVMVSDEGWERLEAHYRANENIFLILKNYVDPVIAFVLFFAIWQLIVTSLLGIYFLTERIQTLNAKP